ncbi:MAG: glycosyltransferase [Paludibacteraceae bacterium]|nr:glycosyltransferase [Paludibacteraceae bacterium]
MRNLLIVCDAFPPSFAPRMGALSKYLQELGWCVYVLTEEQDAVGCSVEGCTQNVLRLKYYKRSGKLAWLGGFLLDYSFNRKNKLLVSLFRKHWRDVKFDAVLCSTYMAFPMQAAYDISKMCGAPLVYDFRDIVEQFVGFEFAKHKIFRHAGLNNFAHKIRRRKIIAQRNRLLAMADAVTTVSPWHKEMLEKILSSGDSKCKSVTVIYNGFDPQFFFPKDIKSNKFVIEYTGRVLDLRLQNPLLLFEALQKLKSQEVINASDFVVNWHTDTSSAKKIGELASSYNVSEFVKIENYVPQQSVPDLLNRSSVILVLTNKMEKGGPQGVLTTKFFEALSVRKPVLCVRSDEAYLAKLIDDTRSGISAINADEVAHFIKKYYAVWKSDGIVKIESNNKLVETFSRKHQAGQFDQLLKKIAVQDNSN